MNEQSIAIVGSRDCTEEGMLNARLFATNIAKEGFVIVSGMAKGIDTVAHSGALEVNGKTIAVLGCGPKYIFPAQNKELYKEILKRDGAIISEYPENTKPSSEKFRLRNRIVSGLSLGVLIIEAEFRSGTSITARLAKEQNRDIFCIPNSITNSKGVGTNILIQKGAKLILSPKEIIEKYKGRALEQISIKDLKSMKQSNLYDLSKIQKEYQEIYKYLAEEESLNEISIKIGISLQELYQTLFMMEMEDLIINVNGKYKVNMK